MWERTERELERAGFRLNRRGHGVRVLATDSPGVGLCLLGADCPLILVYDPARPAIIRTVRGKGYLFAGERDDP